MGFQEAPASVNTESSVVPDHGGRTLQTIRHCLVRKRAASLLCLHFQQALNDEALSFDGLPTYGEFDTRDSFQRSAPPAFFPLNTEILWLLLLTHELALLPKL